VSVTTDKVQPSGLRNVSIVSLHKGAQIVGQMVAVATIPRLLGVDNHGRFAFVLSLAFLGQILGDFGTLEVMGRFVPTMTVVEAKRLYMRTLTFKLIVGVLCGGIAIVAALALSQWMQLDWALLIGLGVLLHIIAWVPFQFFLGLNQVGLWMVEQSWRQWILVILLLLLYPWLGFTGSLIAWASMEAIFCFVGLWWGREYWQISELRLNKQYIWPYIKFGFGFFLANLIGALLYRSGPVLVEMLTGQSAHAGYLNLAIGLFLMPYLLLTQMALSLVPTLTSFYTKGQINEMQQWINNFVRYSWLLGWLAVLLIWLTVDFGVVLVFGVDYALAARPLRWISLAIPLAGLLWAGNAVATVTGRGTVKFWATLITLCLFLVIGIWLIPLYLAAGGALALSMAVGVNVVVLALFLRPEFKLDWPMLLVTGLAGSGMLFVIAHYELSLMNWSLF